MDRVVNVRFTGLGGMGVLKATDIFAEVFFRQGFDVKKAEVHGMSQRGGALHSDVRYGPRVWSPMIPDGEVDYLLVMVEDQVDIHRPNLRPGGVLVSPRDVDASKLESARSLNIALLGALSRHFDVGDELWREALRRNLPEKTLAVNEKAFDLGRRAGAAGA